MLPALVLLMSVLHEGVNADWEPEPYQLKIQLFWSQAVGLICFIALIALVIVQSYRLRKSQFDLKVAQSKSRAFAEASLDAFYILASQRGPDHKIEDFIFTDLNNLGVQLIGKPNDELIGARLCEVLPALRTEGIFDKYVKVVESGELLEEEFEVDTPDIRARWMRRQVIPMGDGIVITMRNISARINAEAETRNSRAFLQSLIDFLPMLIYAKSLRTQNYGKIIVWNKAAEAVTGYPEQQVVGKTNREAFPSHMADVYDKIDQKILTNPMVVNDPEVPFRRPDGGLRFMNIISVPLFDESDQPEYILGIAEDITGRRQQELELRTKQAELNAANDASPLGLFRTDPEGGCTYLNRTYEEMSGLAGSLSMGSGWIEAVHPKDRFKVFQAWREASRTNLPYQGTYRFRHADGRIVWVSVKTAPIIVDGQINGYVGSVDDITARRESEQALAESEQRLRTITDTLPALVAYVDADEHYRFNNLAYERAFGMSRDEIRDKTIKEFLSPAEYAYLKPYIARVLRGETVTFEQEAGEGADYHCNEATYIPQFAEKRSRVVGFHVMVQDVTAKKLEERRLLQLARIDSLTGLFNRSGFGKKLAEAMAQSEASGSLIAVMYLDIDHFKPINDTHGHHVGDLLLKAFAGRLSQVVRSTDTVARLGGDEFTIIMAELSKEEDAEIVAAKIVQTMQPPFFLEDVSVSITTSLGLAFCLAGATESSMLIQAADEMLYLAKQAGRNTYRMASLGKLAASNNG